MNSEGTLDVLQAPRLTGGTGAVLAASAESAAVSADVAAASFGAEAAEADALAAFGGEIGAVEEFDLIGEEGAFSDLGASPDDFAQSPRPEGHQWGRRRRRYRDKVHQRMSKECRERAEREAERKTRIQKATIVLCYTGVAVLWVILTTLLGVAPWTQRAAKESINNPIGWVVFFIPILVFSLGVASVVTSSSMCSVQNAVRGGNILYLGILVAIPLFTLLDSNYRGNRQQFAIVVLTSITCAVLGQLDVWGTADWTCYVHHVESSLKTISIGLLLYALLMFAFNGKYFSKLTKDAEGGALHGYEPGEV